MYDLTYYEVDQETTATTRTEHLTRGEGVEQVARPRDVIMSLDTTAAMFKSSQTERTHYDVVSRDGQRYSAMR